MRGRKPDPTALRILKGNPSRRPLPKGELHPPPAVLTPPGWLSDRAKQHWSDTAPALHRHGLLSELDVWAWGLACCTWAHAMELHELIERDGMVLTGKDGIPRIHPGVRLEEKLWASYLRVSGEFGCSPRSRVGLHVQPSEADPLDTFLDQKARTDKSRFFHRKE